MQDEPAVDPEEDVTEQLYDIVNELLSPHAEVTRKTGLLFFNDPPFDISKPNQHDTKADFEREYNLVFGSLEALFNLVNPLMKTEEKTADDARDIDALEEIIDRKLTDNAAVGPFETAGQMARRNVCDAGGFAVSKLIFIDFYVAMKSRLEELEEQKDKFWDLPHRAPNYHARSIANRLAKLYARETGLRPTSGASSITGEPSTSFTKALEKTFKLLDIKSGSRSPADWAIKNLKDEDFVTSNVTEALGPAPAGFGLGSLFGTDPKSQKN